VPRRLPLTSSSDETEASASTGTRPSGVNNKGKNQAEGEKTFPFAVQRTTLDNGLRILLVPSPSDGLVSYWSIVRTGSRDEVEEGVTGFAHFFEHMMFRGTEKLPAMRTTKSSTAWRGRERLHDDDFTAYHMSFAKATSRRSSRSRPTVSRT